MVKSWFAKFIIQQAFGLNILTLPVVFLLKLWNFSLGWWSEKCRKMEPTTFWKITFKNAPPPKHFRGWSGDIEYMLKGFKPLCLLDFLENPSTFKMWQIFKSNKRKKYIERKNINNEECRFYLECWRKSRKPWCDAGLRPFNMIVKGCVIHSDR